MKWDGRTCVLSVPLHHDQQPTGGVFDGTHAFSSRRAQRDKKVVISTPRPLVPQVTFNRGRLDLTSLLPSSLTLELPKTF